MRRWVLVETVLLCEPSRVLSVLCGKGAKNKQNRKGLEARRKVSQRNASDRIKLHQYQEMGTGRDCFTLRTFACS